MDIDFLTWLGYLASVVTAISLLMSRPLRLRWLNLVGSAIFSVYGVLIQAYPVALFNGLIVFIDAYYIYKIYSSASNFAAVKISGDDGVLRVFLNNFSDDIKNLFPGFDDDFKRSDFIALQMRDMEVCGIIAGVKNGNELNIDIDYTSPNNRDYKPGNNLYRNSSFLKDNGVTKLWASPKTQNHQDYLVKMGFVLDNGRFSKLLAD